MINFLRSFFLGVILALGIFFVSALEAGAKETIRVLILRDVSQFKVSGKGLILKDLKTGRSFFQNRKFSSLTIERSAGPRLRVRNHSFSSPAFLLTCASGPLIINRRRYRDQLRILPAPNGDLWVINYLALEDYLVGLINWEISSQWPQEAVKAQAVVARTYALFQRGNRQGGAYDVDSTVLDQVYGGVGREDGRASQAVRETEGEILLYQGEPIFAVYHACCGGRTESPDSLWSGDYPYLKSIHCNYCLDSPHFLWNYQMERQTLGRVLRSLKTMEAPVLGIDIGERSESNRVLQIRVLGEMFRRETSGKEFRRLLGYDQLRSTNFVVKENEGVYYFSGLGWGHGAGLCQWGAKGMAEAGADYRAILNFYYQGIEIGGLRP